MPTYNDDDGNFGANFDGMLERLSQVSAQTLQAATLNAATAANQQAIDNFTKSGKAPFASLEDSWGGSEDDRWGQAWKQHQEKINSLKRDYKKVRISEGINKLSSGVEAIGGSVGTGILNAGIKGALISAGLDLANPAKSVSPGSARVGGFMSVRNSMLQEGIGELGLWGRVRSIARGDVNLDPFSGHFGGPTHFGSRTTQGN